jgi:hypothetical protein
VLYTTVDLEMISEIIDSESVLTMPFEFALVVETDDEGEARRTWADLIAVLESDPIVRVTKTTLNEVSMDSVVIEIPNGRRTLTVEFLLGVHEGVAFIASPEMAEFVTSDPARAASLDEDTIYTEATGWFLPRTRQLLYASDDGMITMVAFILYAVSGTMGMPDLSANVPASPFVQNSDALMGLAVLRSIMDSASITATLDRDFQITRLALTLK